MWSKYVKKILLSIIIGMLISATTILFIQYKRNSITIDDYSNTITELGKTIDRQAETNRRIKDSNTELIKESKYQLDRTKQAEEIINSIGSGLSKDTESIQDIIKAIDSIIKTIKEYENSSKDS